MKEQLEALSGLLRSAWRFRWSAFVVSVLVCSLGVLVVLLAPSEYQSRAHVYVDTRSVLRPLLQGLAVTTQSRDDSDVVKEALLARPTLARVAQSTGLYARAANPESLEELLTSLAGRIIMHGDSSTGLYTISYQDREPRMSKAVVQALLDAYLDNAIGAGRSDGASAEAFLQGQVAEYERRLSDSEQRLAEFKQKHFGLMPDQRGDYFARLQAEFATRAKIETDLASATRQRDEFRRKIAGPQIEGAAPQTEPSLQQVQAAQILDARLRDARANLEKLMEGYTDQHPRVLAQREMIRRLEQQRERELSGVAPTNAVRTEGSMMPTDPVVQSLQVALNNADGQVAALEAQLRHSDSVVSELQRRVTVGPEIEAELARLNRDYGVTKAQYEALLQRLESAHISNEAERNDRLRFRILDPPRLPLRPVRPNRSLLLVAVLLGGLGLGAALALLRTQLQPVFFTKTAVGAVLGLPVLGTVSAALDAHQRMCRLRAGMAYALAVLILLGGMGAAAHFSFPLSEALRQTLGAIRA